MAEQVSGSASITIDRPRAEVFDAIADITRMGDWSPENTAGRWVDGATGPGLGARFEGDNVAKLGPITLKRWTTTSEVTEYEPGRVFEFLAEGYTTWRFEFEDAGDATKVTETYAHEPYEGWQHFAYETVGRRSAAIPKGMRQTLEQVKAALESS